MKMKNNQIRKFKNNLFLCHCYDKVGKQGAHLAHVYTFDLFFFIYNWDYYKIISLGRFRGWLFMWCNYLIIHIIPYKCSCDSILRESKSLFPNLI